MTRLKCRIMSFVCFLSIIAISLSAYSRSSQTKTATRLRSGPGTNYKIVKVLFAGSKLDVTKCEKSWCLVVTSDGISGWVYESLLKSAVSTGRKKARRKKKEGFVFPWSGPERRKKKSPYDQIGEYFAFIGLRNAYRPDIDYDSEVGVSVSFEFMDLPEFRIEPTLEFGYGSGSTSMGEGSWGANYYLSSIDISERFFSLTVPVKYLLCLGPNCFSKSKPVIKLGFRLGVTLLVGSWEQVVTVEVGKGMTEKGDTIEADGSFTEIYLMGGGSLEMPFGGSYVFLLGLDSFGLICKGRVGRIGVGMVY